MINKSVAGLRPMNLLLIFGMTVALLVSTSSSQKISASVRGGTHGPNTSKSNQSAAVAGPEEGHITPPTNAEQSQGSSQGTAPGSGSGGASSNSNQQAIDHINQAQSALQNGDTAGAQMHMDLAKQALGCSPMDPRGC